MAINYLNIFINIYKYFYNLEYFDYLKQIIFSNFKNSFFSILFFFSIKWKYIKYIICEYLQVTEETKKILEQEGMECECRGVIKIKGKGDMRTYFLKVSDEDICIDFGKP